MKRVLLADDEPLALTLMRHMIDWEHYGLELAGSAQNGDELYEMIFALRPDIVITDIEMPKMDGHRLTKLVMEDEELKHIPIVIFSSLIDEEMRRKGKAVGADEQLSKPEIGHLVEILDYLLEKRGIRHE